MRLLAGVAKDREGECHPNANLLPRGVWGGPHVELAANDPAASGVLKFDCARAEINEPLKLDAGGNFKWKARYTFQGSLATTPPQSAPQDALVVGFISTDRKSLNFRFEITGSTSPASMFGVILGSPAVSGSCL